MKIDTSLAALVLALEGSGCSHFGVMVHEMTHPDRDLTKVHSAWGNIDRASTYRLKEQLFLNGSSLEYTHFAYAVFDGGASYKPRSEYSPDRFPEAIVVPPGTRIQFRHFGVMRRIWGSLPTVSAEIMDGDHRGKRVGVEDLCTLQHTSQDNWILVDVDPRFLEKAQQP
jgi:hypothetical protein